MWAESNDTEDSAGYADSLLDSVFAIAGAVIVAMVVIICRAVLS